MSNTYQQSSLNKSRIDKFKLVFQVPNALKSINGNVRSNNKVIQDTMQFAIYGTVVPAITVPALEIRYAGSTLYNSSHNKSPYPPVTVNFTIDNEYTNYWVIYKWLDLLHSQVEGIFDESNIISNDNFKEYQTDMTIYGLDEFNKERIRFTYTKSFPTDLGGINYNYRESGEIESSFTFVYSQLHTTLLS
jgi:hypothetical protein